MGGASEGRGREQWVEERVTVRGSGCVSIQTLHMTKHTIVLLNSWSGSPLQESGFGSRLLHH